VVVAGDRVTCSNCGKGPHLLPRMCSKIGTGLVCNARFLGSEPQSSFIGAHLGCSEIQIDCYQPEHT
jgi:hypothetical protein